MKLKFRAYDGENFWYFTSDVGVFYKYFGGELSAFDDYLEFSEVLDQGWPVDQWAGQGNIYIGDKIKEYIVETDRKFHYESKFDMMGNEKPVKVFDEEVTIKGWAIFEVKMMGSCMIAERIEDSGNIATSGFYYFNDCTFNNRKIEVIGNTHKEKK